MIREFKSLEPPVQLSVPEIIQPYIYKIYREMRTGSEITPPSDGNSSGKIGDNDGDEVKDSHVK